MASRPAPGNLRGVRGVMAVGVLRVGGKGKAGEEVGWGQGLPRAGQNCPACPLGCTIISKHLPAAGAEEVLGVPGLVQRREDLLQEEVG